MRTSVWSAARVLVALGSTLVGGCRGDEAERDVVPVAQGLGAVIDEFPAPFTGPIRLVELRDGRVLAVDARESRLVLLDFVRRTQVVATTKGDGPLEFRTGFRFARAAADSLWVFDLMRGRILVFSPDGIPVRGFDLTNGESRGRWSVPWLMRVMPDGAWYGRTQGMLLVDARRLTAFDPFDLAAVFSDGRVLVVRGEAYTAEISLPDGTRRPPAPIAHDRVALTVADIEAVRDSMHRMTAGLVAMSMANLPIPPGSAPRMPELMPPDPAPATWPVLMGETIPVDTRDRAWVAMRDSSLATLGQRYDLLDPDGKLVGAVRIPLRYELVGFGREVVYGARRDADDLLWLGRYRLPE